MAIFRTASSCFLLQELWLCLLHSFTGILEYDFVSNSLCRILWQQALYHLGIVQISVIRCCQMLSQISAQIQAVFNGRLDHAEHHGASAGTLGRIGKWEVLPIYDKGFMLRTV